MRRMIELMTLLALCLTLAACGDSPTTLTEPERLVPSPIPPSPVMTPPAPQVASYDVSVQLNPAPIYHSTNPRYKWEVHPRLRIENTGDLVGHIVEVKFDVPGQRRDRDLWYAELEQQITYDAVSVGQTRQIVWMLRFNWDKGFPQTVLFTVRIRDAHGEMHRYEVTWVVGGA